MKRIAVVTATRAEYGLLTPLIRRIENDAGLELDLIVTGAHLSARQGNTIDDIILDRHDISHKIPILDDDNSAYGVSMTMANAIKGFAACFREDRPDMVIILGDRTEMLGVASAAMNERIPMAHIHGGEITEGAVDDCIRHALTKMSYLHFTAVEEYRRRVIQLGESPNRVFNVGALAIENILSYDLMNEQDVRADLGLDMNARYALVTYHPVTLENDTIKSQISCLCSVMAKTQNIHYILTATNADVGGEKANLILQDFCSKNDNADFYYNLGTRRYLSAIKYASFVLGNSSSGILEAPVFGTPTVNVGDRQKGRIMPETIINCESDEDSIVKAVNMALYMKHRGTNIYGDGSTSYRILKIVKEFIDTGINLKKGFYDIEAGI